MCPPTEETSIKFGSLMARLETTEGSTRPENLPPLGHKLQRQAADGISREPVQNVSLSSTVPNIAKFN